VGSEAVVGQQKTTSKQIHRNGEKKGTSMGLL